MKLSGLSATTSGDPWATTSPPPSPPKRTKVDDPVGGLHHVEIVLDHQHGVALIDQTTEHVQQLADVLEVQAGRRLVEDVDGVAGAAFGQLTSELDPLGFAARQVSGPTGRAGHTRGRHQQVSACDGRSAAGSRRTQAPLQQACSTRRQSSCP